MLGRHVHGEVVLAAEDLGADGTAGLAAVDRLVSTEAGAREEALRTGRTPKPAACNTRTGRAGLRRTGCGRVSKTVALM